jgi:hypothetical protein
MTSSTTDDLKQKITSELNLMMDDIHVTEDAMTFYLTTGKTEEAEQGLDRNVEVLEEHKYENLVKIDL